MRFIVLCVLLSTACMTQETRDWQDQRKAERKRKEEVADKEWQELVAWQEANRLVIEDDKWVVLEVRASHILTPATSVDSGGSPALGSVAGGSAAALAGFGPVGIVAGAALGASLSNESTTKVVVSSDGATCVIIGKKSLEVKTFVFNKDDPKSLGLCLTSRGGDIIVFRTSTYREWRRGTREEITKYRTVTKDMFLEAKPK